MHPIHGAEGNAVVLLTNWINNGAAKLLSTSAPLDQASNESVEGTLINEADVSHILYDY